ncbi:DUF5681 domain-containing protein [Brucella anthropi]|uniref:DUF5681 domain-containing protein n=1 Tax=Brucella anthropi TaxID=529 RepID=UPI0021655B0F|nr:DUF5681 domain-containing protein [Brucella anthropi]UVV67080.1 DUF5681 domain-containing protein [Brucella anthropi]
MAKKPLSEKQLANLRKHAFSKGMSGNPKGRPPLADELKTAIAYLSPSSLLVIEEIMLYSKNDMARLKAAEIFLSTTVPKAAQKVDIDVDVQITHTADLLAKAAKARELIEGNIIEAELLPPPDEKKH